MQKPIPTLLGLYGLPGTGKNTTAELTTLLLPGWNIYPTSSQVLRICEQRNGMPEFSLNDPHTKSAY